MSITPCPVRPTGCDRCDDQNVEVPGTLYSAALDLHRALHELYRPVEKAIVSLLERVT